MTDAPRLTIRCEYPDESSTPSEVSFRMSPSYGLTTGHEAHEWFIEMMRDHGGVVIALSAPGCQ